MIIPSFIAVDSERKIDENPMFSKRILIVDDQLFNQQSLLAIIKLTFKKSGVSDENFIMQYLDVAQDGLEAFNQVVDKW